MYNFVDTIDSGGENTRPAEALMINGQWIEDIVPGYRTLSVSGRELAEWEIESRAIGFTDGERYARKRLEPRLITVMYQMISSTPADFRDAFTKLNSVINVEQAQLSFNDEPDNYFTGTPQGLGDNPEPGALNVIGSFDILCSDPKKYSVSEVSVSPTVSDTDISFLIDYTGTEKSYPVIEAEMASQNGYIGFINQDGAILQIGNPDEVDIESVQLSEEVASDDFRVSTTLQNWAVNDANTSHVQNGALTSDTRGAYPASYGSGSAWHGVSLTRVIDADSNGHVGAVNATLTVKSEFAIPSTNALGGQWYQVTTADGTQIAAISLTKNTVGVNYAFVDLFVTGKLMQTVKLPPMQFGYVPGTGIYTIGKFGSTITFGISGKIYSFKNPDLLTLEVVQEQLVFLAWGTQQTANVSYINYTKLMSHSVQSWQDVPNKFAAGDIVKVDCASGTIYLNDVEMDGLGALGNDWEGFYLSPGNNQISCVCSDWASAPDYTLTYREVYL